MSTSGVDHIFIETRDWSATVAFWRRLGFELEFETDHHSGLLRHPLGGTYLFVAEQLDRAIEQQICLSVPDAAACALDGMDVEAPFRAEHWGVMEAVVRDPDGRRVSLQAPLGEGGG